MRFGPASNPLANQDPCNGGFSFNEAAAAGCTDAGEGEQIEIDCSKQAPEEIVVNAPAQLFNLQRQDDAAAQLTANQLNSRIAEAYIGAQLTAVGKFTTAQVTFTFGGATSRIDFVTRQTVGQFNAFDFIEVKFNAGSLTAAQEIVFPGIGSGEAVPLGTNARRARLAPNQSLGSQLANFNAFDGGPVPLIVRVCPVE